VKCRRTSKLDFVFIESSNTCSFMMTRAKSIFQTACWIAVFSAIGFVLVKLCFMLLCWMVTHSILEAMFSAVIPIAFGAAIGFEAYLWRKDLLRDRLTPRHPGHGDG